jgi:hypothetical protein
MLYNRHLLSHGRIITIWLTLLFDMTKRPYSHIPSFKGYSFKPLEPERQEDLGAAMDASLQPEEQGTIKRYLRYADTLINSSEPNDETPADNQSTHEVSLLGAHRSTDKDLPSNGDPSTRDKPKKAA